MDNQEITKASLLQSKAKMMADRNERFAVIEEEVSALKEDIGIKLNILRRKIVSSFNESQNNTD